MSVRRPSPSILLLLSGIEHSVGAQELKGALASFNSDLAGLKDLAIRESMGGVRSVVVKVPFRAGLKLL